MLADLIGNLHGRHVFQRRVRVLGDRLSALLLPGQSVLDVGCGDGSLASEILQRRPDLSIQGIDVLVRDGTRIPVMHFDGKVIPCADASTDVVMFVDVLHHTEDPRVLLSEARRVAKNAILIKEHLSDGRLASPTLRLMDYIGNAHHGVALPYNYWPRHRWQEAFAELGLRVEAWQQDLGLYPPPASWIFDRSLHFIARLRPEQGEK